MCIEADLRVYRTLFDESSALERLLSELGVDRDGVARALRTALERARMSDVVSHGDAVHERLMVAAGVITFRRQEGDDMAKRTRALQELLAAVSREERGAEIVMAVEQAIEKARRLYEEYLKNQEKPRTI